MTQVTSRTHGFLAPHSCVAFSTSRTWTNYSNEPISLSLARLDLSVKRERREMPTSRASFYFVWGMESHVIVISDQGRGIRELRVEFSFLFGIYVGVYPIERLMQWFSKRQHQHPLILLCNFFVKAFLHLIVDARGDERNHAPCWIISGKKQ